MDRNDPPSALYPICKEMFTFELPDYLNVWTVRTDGPMSSGQASESKNLWFESHICHLVQAYGHRYVPG